MATPTSENRKLTPNDVPELRKFFREVPPRNRMSSLEAVRQMTADIAGLQAKGYSLADIGEMIEKQGFDLPLSTFRNYLRQCDYKKKRTDEREASQPISASSSKRSSKNRAQRSTSEEPETGRFRLDDDPKV